MISLPCKKPDLYNFSPHKGRMLLLDQVDSVDLDNIKMQSSIRINNNSEFYNTNMGYVPVWVSFEYIAQSIACLSGIISKQKESEPEIGFIIGVRDFEAKEEGFKIDDNVIINISQVFRNGDVATFFGQVFVNNKLYSSATLNVINNNLDIMEKWISKG